MTSKTASAETVASATSDTPGDNASVSFSLFAPYNTEAVLRGSFSGWEDIPMTKGDDGVFRVELSLADGDYTYKFRVRSKSWFVDEDAFVDVVDPYATAVEDTEQANGVLCVQNGARITDAYVWQHDDKPLPPDHSLVIYELHVGDFSGEGDLAGRGRFEDVVAKLDYLSDLGVNAVELMPVEEYPGDHSWGYNPRYFFAAESSYGSSADLKALVDACHSLGIRVIKDGVYNHSEASSPLTQIDHDYWYHHEPRDPDNNWGPEFNYEKYDENLDTYPARKFVGDAVRYWTSEYHLDGLRFDAARQMENFDFMYWVTREAKRVAGDKPFYTVAEYIPETPEVTGVDGPMDACWHDSFYHTLKEVMHGERVDFERLKNALDAKRTGFPGATNVINYLSNHDHNHVMADLGDAGILGEEAFRRVRLGAALLMTAVGVPLVWMGDEFGEFTHTSVEQNKLDWALLGNDANRNLRETFKGLIGLRTSSPALFTANIDFFHENPDKNVIAYTRWDEGSRVVIVANLSADFHGGYTVPDFPAQGTLHEWTGDYDVTVEGDSVTLDLPPFEAKVFVG